jgi:hypothetical protein
MQPQLSLAQRAHTTLPAANRWLPPAGRNFLNQQPNERRLMTNEQILILVLRLAGVIVAKFVPRVATATSLS